MDSALRFWSIVRTTILVTTAAFSIYCFSPCENASAVEASNPADKPSEVAIQPECPVAALAYDGGTRLAAQYFTIDVPDGMFPGGFTWRSDGDVSTPLPEGATDAVEVVDATTGEVAMTASRVGPLPEDLAPLDSSWLDGLGEVPGFVQFYCGEARSTASGAGTGVAFCVAEGRLSDPAAFWPAPGESPTVSVEGLLNEVYGLFEGDVPREAFVAAAEPVDGGLLIEAAGYSVLVPEEYLGEGMSCTYTDNAAGTDSLFFCLPRVGCFSVSCLQPGDDSSTPVDGGRSVAGTTPGGLEVAVETQGICFDGGQHTDPDRAAGDAEMIAGWVRVDQGQGSTEPRRCCPG